MATGSGTANTVGINVRTIGSFWKVVKYARSPCRITCAAFTYSPSGSPGVVGSLYGHGQLEPSTPSSWTPKWPACFPRLRSSPEDQLTATVNLLHAMGKVVGMDVIPPHRPL